MEDGIVIGSVGLARFEGIDNCCELQKLYLDDSVKGQGPGHNISPGSITKKRGLRK